MAGCCCCCDVVLNALPLKVLHCTGGDLFIRVLTGPAWCRSSYLYFVICILYFVFVLYFVFFILHRWRPFYQGAAGSSWAWSRPSKVHPPAHGTRKMVCIEGTREAAVITCRGFVRINYTLEAPFCPPYHKPVIITTRRKMSSIGGNQ